MHYPKIIDPINRNLTNEEMLIWDIFEDCNDDCEHDALRLAQSHWQSTYNRLRRKQFYAQLFSTITKKERLATAQREFLDMLKDIIEEEKYVQQKFDFQCAVSELLIPTIK